MVGDCSSGRTGNVLLGIAKSSVPIARTTIQAITSKELELENVKQQIQSYDSVFNEKLNHDPSVLQEFHLYREDEDPIDIDHNVLLDPDAAMPNEDNVEVDSYDLWCKNGLF